jgi:hypothetical protein
MMEPTKYKELKSYKVVTQNCEFECSECQPPWNTIANMLECPQHPTAKGKKTFFPGDNKARIITLADLFK